MTITLQAGHFYRTEGDLKAFVAGKNPFHPDRWIGAVEDYFSASATAEWYDGGTHRGCKRELDLIAEWTEPRSGEVWVNVMTARDSVLFNAFGSKELADHFAGGRIACVKLPWKENEYD